VEVGPIQAVTSRSMPQPVRGGGHRSDYRTDDPFENVPVCNMDTNAGILKIEQVHWVDNDS
jgi:hypothetical protein